jgi:hypothetical protein
MERIDNLMRWAGVRSLGAFRIIYTIQGTLEDVRAALDASQTDTALHQAREALLACLSIRNMHAGGALNQWRGEFCRSDGNMFSHISDDELDAVDALMATGWQAATDADRTDWVAQLYQYAADTEQLLGLEAQLGSLRSPNGLSAALRVFGELDKFAVGQGLPSVVPAEWNAL